MRSLMAFFFVITAFWSQSAFSQEIQIGLSNDTVAISSSFDGTDLIVFGTIEGADAQRLIDRAYEVAVVLIGPLEPVVVRRKERRFGVWVNGKSMRFENIPASYSVATSKALDEIADQKETSVLQIGLQNLQMAPLVEDADSVDARTFRESLKRIKTDKALFVEKIGGVEFISPSLFKARVPLPASVPIGEHRARAFLFSEGKMVSAKSVSFQVRKIGFEQFTYDLAHSNGLLYGIIAVLVAITTGWLANVIFQKD
ncbi:MAG: TIGR02186 family protein [Pseudomonadota bacterium]